LNDKAKLLSLLKEKDESDRRNRLKFYDPYPFQVEFHNDDAPRKALETGNQQGKCGTIISCISTNIGDLPLWKIFGNSILVETPTGYKPVLNWVRKPAEECFRITMSDGRWFECPRGHRIKTSSGFVYVSQLLDAFPSPIERVHRRASEVSTSSYIHWLSSSVFSQLVRVLNVGRYYRKLEDYLGGYLVDYRLRDAPLLYDQEGVQVFSPLPIDAPRHNGAEYSLGGLANKCTGILCRSLLRLSSPGAYFRILAPFLPSLSPFSLGVFRYKTHYNENDLQSVYFEGHHLPSSEVHSYQSEFLASSIIPVSIKGNHIVSIRSVGVNVLYDFEVKGHEYIAGGMIHHNTTCGCSQDAFDLTGLYPDWYTGKRYDRPISLVCGGINNDKTRDLLQKALCGDPVTKDESLGSGWIPGYCLDRSKISLKRGVSDAYLHVKVKHHTDGVFDGWSNLTFQSYESGKAAWMGDTIDIFHLDEEPPEDILAQAGRGCIASKGIIRCTYTPENGQTNVVIKIKKEWSLHKAGWHDASGEEFDYKVDGEVIHFKEVRTIGGKLGHITKQTVMEAEKDFAPYQMKMRMLGIPVLGSGQVFTYSEEDIKIMPLDNIPDSWPRGAAIDFGGVSDDSHPTAVVFGAHDKLNDVLYIYDGFRTYGSEISEVAAKIIDRPNSNWIPMFWPHDGGKNVPGGGTVAGKYRSYGINMFNTHFTNPDDDKEEGKGGIKIEPGIVAISGRIASRQLRVYNTFQEWFEEYRNYHQKDGKIVDRDDDILAATRYLLQMLRHFSTEEEILGNNEEDEYIPRQSNNKWTGY